MKREKKDNPISIRFPKSLYDKICQEAEEGERTLGEQVLYYLRRAIESEDNTRERFQLFEQSQAHMEEPRAEGREANGTDDT